MTIATIKAMVKNSIKRKRIRHKKKRGTERQSKTHIIYSITVRKASEEHPNEISKSIIIMSAMLAQERLRRTEHLLAYISSDILLLLIFVSF